ncbi:MAG: zf-TFIIB domain-containing protein [Nitrospinae bacterium]|nr:zf-TFIIB domain-containing protein [Nitrospinota bacterium]MBL7019975.1 zf-TFIIB domain-containing protein [Nitrospinaceae bacterium]
MKCPACKNALHESVVAGVKIQACPGECGGLWINRFQFKKIQALKPGIGQSLLMIERAEGVKTYRGAEHVCPACEITLLHRHFFSTEGDSEVNQCSKCRGFWIDLAGLAKLKSLPADQRRQAVENYFTTVIDVKLSQMRILHNDMAQQAQILTQILQFLCPEDEWTG